MEEQQRRIRRSHHPSSSHRLRYLSPSLDNRRALRRLAVKGIDPSAFRSKSWDEFAAPSAPAIDIAITVCGNAAGEACPLFIGAPIRGHWGLPDPADVTGSDAEVDAAFDETWRLLELRVRALLALPFDTMEPAELRAALVAIGRLEGAA